MKKNALAVLFCALFLLFAEKSYSASFEDFSNALQSPNYDIDLSAYTPLVFKETIYGMPYDPTRWSDYMASSGTIRGLSGDDYAEIMGISAGRDLRSLLFLGKQMYWTDNFLVSSDVVSQQAHNAFIAAEGNSKIVFFNSSSTFSKYYEVFAPIDSMLLFNDSTITFKDNNTNFILRYEQSSSHFSNSQVTFIGGETSLIYGVKFYFLNSTASFVNSSVYMTDGDRWGNPGIFYAADSQMSWTEGGETFIAAFKSDLFFERAVISFTSNAISNAAEVNIGAGIVVGYGDDTWLYNGTPRFTFTSATVNFIENTVQDGGIIFARQSSFTFINSSASFIRNSSASAMALFKRSEFYFYNSTALFIDNAGVSSGGAVFATDGSKIIFENSSVAFTGNKANFAGGLFYIGQNSGISIFAGGNDILFIDNSAAGRLNDIYFEGSDGYLELSANAGRQIIMEGGFLGGNYSSRITKTGDAFFHIKETAQVDYKGRFEILSGITSFSVTSSAIGTLQIADGASFILDGEIQHKIFLSNLDAEGFLRINIDLTNRVSDIFEIDDYLRAVEGSTLSINLYGSLGNDYHNINIFHIKQGIDNRLNGFFNYLFANGASNISLWDDYSNMSASGYMIGRDSANNWIYFNSVENTPWNIFAWDYRSVADGGIIFLNERTKAEERYDSSGTVISIPIALGSATNSNFAIDGQGQVLCSEGRQDLGFRIFNSSITFTDITLRTFRASQASTGTAEPGGAIYADGSHLYFGDAVKFFSNSSNYGGAIYAKESNFYFYGEEIKFVSNGGNQGGAIYSTSSYFHIDGASLKFSRNNTNLGGAIVARNSSFVFSNSLINFENNAGSGGGDGYGGAIYLQNSTFIFSNSQLNFSDNETTNYGGAFYIDGGSVIISGGNNDISFVGNKAGGNPNDFYFDLGGAYLELSANAGHKIIMDGGIMGGNTDTTIKKSGDAVLYIKETAQVDYKGKLEISEGITNFSVIKSSINVLEIAQGANFIFDGETAHEIYLQNLIISGTLSINVDLTAGISGIFEISGIMKALEGSSLCVNFYNGLYYYGGDINIFHLYNGSAGGDLDFSYLLGNGRYSVILDPNEDWIKLQYISPPNPSVGSFYANLSALSAMTLGGYGIWSDVGKVYIDWGGG